MRLELTTGWLLAAVLWCCAGCGQKESIRKPTYPVTGQIFVDGQPVPALAVTVHSLTGIDTEQPTYSQAFTDAEGRFSISTYEAGDGVPVGEYALTVMWGRMNPIAMSYDGPDKLGDRYTDPQTSNFKFTVEEGVPTDLGRLELTTQGAAGTPGKGKQKGTKRNS